MPINTMNAPVRMDEASDGTSAIGCQRPLTGEMCLVCSQDLGACKGCCESGDRVLKMVDGRFINPFPTSQPDEALRPFRTLSLHQKVTG